MSNRIIKFRAWDRKNKEWLNDYYTIYVEDGDVYIYNSNGYTAFMERKDAELMQFTGFQIKGQDLWEDDIVREETPTDGFDEVRYLVCTWISEWGMWGLLHADGEWQSYKAKGVTALDQSMFWTFPIDQSDEKYRTICGNIHQHSNKLLNQ